jgi:hypothetical protein
MIRSFFVRVIVCGLLLCVPGLVEAKLDAQEIKIKLIDGRNGRPLANMCERLGGKGPQRGDSDTD